MKGTLHWVSASHAVPAEIRLYDHLFTEDTATDINGEEGQSALNPNSLVVLPAAMAEPVLSSAQQGSRFQFLRLGYFCMDKDSRPEALVFNRIVSLRDSWAKAKTS